MLTTNPEPLFSVSIGKQATRNPCQARTQALDTLIGRTSQTPPKANHKTSSFYDRRTSVAGRGNAGTNYIEGHNERLAELSRPTWRGHRDARHEHGNVPLEGDVGPREADGVQVAKETAEHPVDGEPRDHADRLGREDARPVFSLAHQVVLLVVEVV